MVRIRKNATRPPLLFCSHASSADHDLLPRVCNLNRSPWDVWIFDSFSHQSKIEDSFYVNMGLGDSVGAERRVSCLLENVVVFDTKRSVASPPMDVDEKSDFDAVVHIDDNVVRRCQKTNGKGWQCKREAKRGLLQCEHHRNLANFRYLKYTTYTDENSNTTSSNGSGGSLPLERAKGQPGSRRVRPKAASKKSPYEFSYYSGINPRSGRKRRGTSEDNVEAKVVTAQSQNVVTTTHESNLDSLSKLKVDNWAPLDYIEDDFDDDDEEDRSGEGGRKRMRRHVKARSLKSLM